ncbi:COILED-COIL DOMAIN-CONTAINING PROTEIN 84 [Salix viminalis]|uniref:COILED-COIL DOMAIN-CONTAINING PROTEIN 84 n=1 Tax=Salix viminalis TaxID=40686 RepID=A0A9Q0NLV2_SALVM|nr:COILED-COIL DOMAIN-CONTAINING PROTEIN 84 [Salix viminalis]
MNQKMKTNNEKKKKKKKNTEFEFCKACNFESRSRPKPQKALPFYVLNSPLAIASGASSAISISTKLAATSHVLRRLVTWRLSGRRSVKLWGNEASSYSDGSRGMQVGTSNDIRDELSHENINSFENNSLDNVNLNISNVVMPLQYYTNEYQISNPGFSAVRNAGPSMYGAVSTLPVDTCSATNLCNSNDTMGNWNGQHSVPYNNINCASDPVNGELCQVYQSEIIRHGVSSLQDSQNIPQVPAMAPQLTGGTRVPALTPQMAGGNVHTGAPPPWFEGTDTNQLNFQPTISNKSMSISNKSGKSHKLNPKRVGAAWAERRKMEMEMEKRGEAVKSDYNANWLPNFGRVWQSGSRKESRKEFEKEKQKLSNVEIDTEMPIMIQPYISKRMRKDAGIFTSLNPEMKQLWTMSDAAKHSSFPTVIHLAKPMDSIQFLAEGVGGKAGNGGAEDEELPCSYFR